MIFPPKKLVYSWKQKGLFRQSLSICVDTLLCGDGDHKEPWTFLSFFVILRCLQRQLAWVLDACRVWMTGLVVETLIYHWGFLVQQVMSLSKIGKDFMNETCGSGFVMDWHHARDKIPWYIEVSPQVCSRISCTCSQATNLQKFPKWWQWSSHLLKHRVSTGRHHGICSGLGDLIFEAIILESF